MTSDDVANILFEYAEQAGLVVSFPHRTSDYARAVIEYANQLESDLVIAEKKNDQLDTMIRQASENEIYIAGLLERIRDLEAQLAQAKARHEQPERDYSWGSHP